MSRTVPAFADSQRDEILRLLREAKLRGEGVRRSDLIFAYRFTQCGARIHELERMGYRIENRQEQGQRYVTYFLLAEPERLNLLPTYQPKVFRESPYMQHVRAERKRAMPLFGGQS